MSPEDVGTRQQHYIELFELWNDALQKVEASAKIFPSKYTLSKLEVIKNAVHVLGVSMMAGYKEVDYSREINKGVEKDGGV